MVKLTRVSTDPLSRGTLLKVGCHEIHAPECAPRGLCATTNARQALKQKCCECSSSKAEAGRGSKSRSDSCGSSMKKPASSKCAWHTKPPRKRGCQRRFTEWFEEPWLESIMQTLEDVMVMDPSTPNPVGTTWRAWVPTR